MLCSFFNSFEKIRYWILVWIMVSVNANSTPSPKTVISLFEILSKVTGIEACSKNVKAIIPALMAPVIAPPTNEDFIKSKLVPFK